MLIAIEGIAGSGKTTLRESILESATATGVPVRHVGQFSWLSLPATRALVAIRTGRTVSSETAAQSAVLDDLRLHTRYNLSLTGTEHVIADRLILSSVCLIALTCGGNIDDHLTHVTDLRAAQPDLTVLLTTPVQTCLNRIRARPAANRVGDRPEQAAQLSGLYERAATRWERVSGHTVWQQPLLDHRDTEQLTREILDFMTQGGC